MLYDVSSLQLGAIETNCATMQKFQEANNEMGAGSFCKRGPTSPFISFPHLFLLLSPLLAPERLQYLRNCHREFQVATSAFASIEMYGFFLVDPKYRVVPNGEEIVV